MNYTKIPVLDMDFLVWALGGEDEIIKIRDSSGLDLTTLEPGESDIYGKLSSYRGVGFEIGLLNYTCSFNYYPDISITFGSADHFYGPNVICEDIGENETKEESILRVKTWFHDEVIPAYLTSLFS
jgi:hypothetical protein